MWLKASDLGITYTRQLVPPMISVVFSYEFINAYAHFTKNSFKIIRYLMTIFTNNHCLAGFEMKLHLYFAFLHVFHFCAAFFPTNPLTLTFSAITHRTITKAGLWCSVIEFLKTNPRYLNEKRADELTSVDTESLLEGRINTGRFRLVRSSKFKDAVKEIEYANAEVDENEPEKTAAHFDAEQFREGSLRLIRLKKQVISLIKQDDDSEVHYTKARKEAGTLLHTLQDFYSHSNWIEYGNNDPLSILGREIIDESIVADADEKTCYECTPATLTLFTDDCENNLINTGKLTSGYYGGQDVTKPAGVGKCSHGGIFDQSRKLSSQGGINKDSPVPFISPHYR